MNLPANGENNRHLGGEDVTSLAYMLRLATPMVIITISFTAMQAVDRFMVSRVGTDEFAAVGPAAQVAFLAGGFAMGTMAALNALVSQCFGAGRLRECASYYWQMVYLGVAFFAVIIAVMVPTAGLIFRMMNQPAEIVGMEVTYLRVVLLAHILAVVNWASGQFYVGIHRSYLVLWGSITGQVINVVANYILIFGKFGAPELGLVGAAWGTLIGIAVGAAINLGIIWGPGLHERFGTRHSLGVDLAKMGSLLKVGLPAGVALAVNVPCWMIILSTLVGGFGTAPLAATNAVLSSMNVSVMPVVGVGMALTAAVGKSIGAGRKDLVAKQTLVCVRMAIIYMGLVGVGFLVFRHWVIRLWNDEPAVIEAGVKIIFCAAIYQVFHAARTIYTAALRAAGDTMWLAMTSAVGSLVVLGGGGVLMLRLFPALEYMGPWIMAGVSIGVVGLAHWWRFRGGKWMQIDLFKRPAAGPVQPESTVE